MILRSALAALLLLALLAFGGAAQARERILSFDAAVRVMQDGVLEVTETIRVRAEGALIKRGIYRDFPVRYQDLEGRAHTVGFSFLGATRDGKEDAWHAEYPDGMVRVYIGKAEVLLDPGEYTYVLRYRTTRQLARFDTHDELFWNVTGNGWALDIEQVSARIELPRPVAAAELSAYGYTGPPGSRETALNATVEDGIARYRGTRPLAAGEGLSVVLEFPQGLIQESRWQRLLRAVRAIGPLPIAIAGVLIVWLWYGWRWWVVGRDPQRGVMLAQYEPPEGHSPAALRFIERARFDSTCLAAAILSLASRGALRIEQDESDGFTLVPIEGFDRAILPADERTVHEKLFPTPTPLPLSRDPQAGARLRAARFQLHRSLRDLFSSKYGVRNHRAPVIFGAVLSVLAQAAIVASPLEIEPVALGMAATLVLLLPLIFVLVLGYSFWARAERLAMKVVLVLAFAVVAVLGFFGFREVASMTVPLPAVSTLIFLASFLAFLHLMKARTLLGSRLVDRIRGFRWYLSVAEKHELDSRHRLGTHPELFGRYLPYALALGVEQAWAERFAADLPDAEHARAQPGWYLARGAPVRFDLVSLSRAVGKSMQSSLSIATAPLPGSGGSSSGFLGGGGFRSGSRSSGRSSSSGGGGGGGGGGGW